SLFFVLLLAKTKQPEAARRPRIDPMRRRSIAIGIGALFRIMSGSLAARVPALFFRSLLFEDQIFFRKFLNHFGRSALIREGKLVEGRRSILVGLGHKLFLFQLVGSRQEL